MIQIRLVHIVGIQTLHVVALIVQREIDLDFSLREYYYVFEKIEHEQRQRSKKDEFAVRVDFEYRKD